MDKYIVDFVKNNKISKEQYDKNLSKFLECEKSLSLCQNCRGLYTCAQKSVGERVGLKLDGVILETVEYCEYKKKDILIKDLKKSYVYSDIPDQYYSLSLDNIPCLEDETKYYMAKVLEIYKGKTDKGLYVTGDMGVGKTYMMMALSNSLVKENKKVAFIKTTNFINDMRRIVASDDEQYDHILKNLKTCEYLFVDDIGSESVSTFSRDDLLFNILDYRMENKLMTCFTSNYDKMGLLEHYSYLKSGKAETLQAKRLLERIDILGESFVLTGKNKRR